MTASRISSKLMRGEHRGLNDTIETVGHYCPACNRIHDFAVDKPFRNGAKWSFDGNVDSPTFSPSMNISVGPYSNGTIDRCHYFLKAGVIQYLNDCTHELKGQLVPLPDIPEQKWLAYGVVV